jgi:hypothetical protein
MLDIADLFGGGGGASLSRLSRLSRLASAARFAEEGGAELGGAFSGTLLSYGAEM